MVLHNQDTENCVTLQLQNLQLIFGVNHSILSLNKKQKKSVNLLMEVMELAEKILVLSHQKLDKGEKIVSHFQRNLMLLMQLNSVKKKDSRQVNLQLSHRVAKKKNRIQEETQRWISHLISVKRKRRNSIILSSQFQLSKLYLKRRKKNQDLSPLVIRPQLVTQQKSLREIPQSLKNIAQNTLMTVLLLMSHNHQEMPPKQSKVTLQSLKTIAQNMPMTVLLPMSHNHQETLLRQLKDTQVNPKITAQIMMMMVPPLLSHNHQEMLPKQLKVTLQSQRITVQSTLMIFLLTTLLQILETHQFQFMVPLPLMLVHTQRMIFLLTIPLLLVVTTPILPYPSMELHQLSQNQILMMHP